MTAPVPDDAAVIQAALNCAVYDCVRVEAIWDQHACKSTVRLLDPEDVSWHKLRSVMAHDRQVQAMVLRAAKNHFRGHPSMPNELTMLGVMALEMDIANGTVTLSIEEEK